MNKPFIAIIILLFTSPLLRAQADSTIIEPVADNTIYSEGMNNLSNGSGEYLFSGTTKNGDMRRTLLKFDLSSLPDETVADSVILSLGISKSNAGNKLAKIYKLSASWGEGASNADNQEGKGAEAQTDDATWNFRFLETDLWTNAGGDFNEEASDSTIAGNSGTLIFKGDTITANVNDWLLNPSDNFGWIIIVDESSIPSSKRFYSRQNSNSNNRPKLKVYYAGAVSSQPAINIKKAFHVQLMRPGQILINTGITGSNYQLSLFNIAGALVEHKNIYLSPANNLVETKILNKGVYILVIDNDVSRFTEKIVVL
jgi:hypothetical protein